LANRIFVISGQTDQDRHAASEARHLVELVFTVNDSEIDSVFVCEPDVRVHFLGLRVDNLVRRDAEFVELIQNEVKFSHRSAVEVGPEAREELKNLGIRVALDGVVGLDHGEVYFPLGVLLDDRSQVHSHEGCVHFHFVDFGLHEVLDRGGDVDYRLADYLRKFHVHQCLFT
jgi:hypothetical protein